METAGAASLPAQAAIPPISWRRQSLDFPDFPGRTALRRRGHSTHSLRGECPSAGYALGKHYHEGSRRDTGNRNSNPFLEQPLPDS
jgi:hypothetical protein